MTTATGCLPICSQ